MTETTRDHSESLLAEHFRETRRQVRGLLLKIWGGGFLVVLFGFALAWFFIQPAPPRRIVMATGPTDGAYHRFALQYRDYLGRQGVTLELRPTAGSIENYQLLDSDPQVTLAIVQGGTVPETFGNSARIESLASLYFEPIWVFYRGEASPADLRGLGGKRIAVGRPGSGTESIAKLLLDENGIDSDSGATLVGSGGVEAVTQLKQGQIDAAIFVLPPESGLIRQLIADRDIHLMNFQRDDAYSRRHPFLTAVTLQRGVIDLQHDYPPRDVQLIAPAANLIATRSLHDALIPLLLRAATQTHRGEESLLQPGRLPSTEFVEFPLNQSAQVFFEDGPPFLQKYLPFWVASAINRGKILLLPAVTLLLPLFRMAPPLYRWRIRSRIYRWYEILRGIESELRGETDVERLVKDETTLVEMQGELDDLKSVPLSYMEEFYNLRLHVEFVQRRVRNAIEAQTQSLASDSPPSAGASEKAMAPSEQSPDNPQPAATQPAASTDSPPSGRANASNNPPPEAAS
ncbi:TAXI family TRAP transporter solute-binding subunit [Rhodopirellula sp. JC639]|uniref:TAXI family TRAP transporter solute-binding subunit n=1 Tax=Stieleria mannarensis TaxID=2755585 RepID=UPI001603B128|nr:TAXI family TRAP transporter solute-binding subunit [Rhodopirellula sp. JC639]